jgi:hypothetical protein
MAPAARKWRRIRNSKNQIVSSTLSPALAPDALAAAVLALPDEVKIHNGFCDIVFTLELPCVARLCRSCEQWGILS